MARMEYAEAGFGDMAAIDSAEALFELGLFYATGRNGDADAVSAHKWFNIAAYRGHEGAKMHREEIAGEMSREEIAKAQREARDWIVRH